MSRLNLRKNPQCLLIINGSIYENNVGPEKNIAGFTLHFMVDMTLYYMEIL